jgi:hypothetical protein
MTTQISNIKREIFVTKEHYLHFRQSWKDFINSGKAKPRFESDAYGRYKYSNLRGSHHLLFCILTEKDLSVTFKPSDCESKHGFEDAHSELMRMYVRAAKIVEHDAGINTSKRPSYLTPEKYRAIMDQKRAEIDEYLEPFGKSFTIEMFTRLIKDYVKPVKLSNVKLDNGDDVSEAA